MALSVWALLLRTRLESIPTPCPNMPALTWYPRAASGPRPCQKSSQTKETLFPSGWIRRGEYFTASTIPAPCCSSAAFGPQSHSGPSSMSTVWPEECNCWVRKRTVHTVVKPIHAKSKCAALTDCKTKYWSNVFNASLVFKLEKFCLHHKWKFIIIYVRFLQFTNCFSKTFLE